MAQRADHRQLMHDWRGAGQQFADVNPRHAGGDGAELTASGGRPLWLGIPGLLLGMPAVKIQNDDRTRLAKGGATRRRRLIASAQQIRQKQPQATSTAEMQHLAAIPAAGEAQIPAANAV